MAGTSNPCCAQVSEALLTNRRLTRGERAPAAGELRAPQGPRRGLLGLVQLSPPSRGRRRDPPPRCFGASLSPQLCSYRHCEASRGLFEAPDVKTRREWEGKHDGHKERRHLGPRHCGLLVKAGEPLHPSQGSVPYPSGRVGTTSWLKRGWRGHSTPKRGEGYTRGGCRPEE